ncbi:MAG: hypothetical protein RJA99_3311 [Pseudomonadota bacterium]|jgi:hypothetical protein
MLSDNARRLESAVTSSLAVVGIPSEEDVLELASQLRTLPKYKVDDVEFDALIKRLHEALRITMKSGTFVAVEHVPWLSARKSEIEPFYWRRYASHLRLQGWGPRVLSTLDEVTDEILDRLGNPAISDGWPRRGLVMGDVQSGKTSNYTGLICKAADAGYGLVILLTGTLEALRRQTQGRLDEGFVGVDSSGVVTRERKKKDVGVGRINGTRVAGVFTSTLKDFNAATMQQLGFRLAAFKEPVLVVVKKHKKILENLAAWLEAHNADGDGKIHTPMLLIDDEADNASVNTRGENSPTAINEAIRRLLHVFPRSSYVGFTATPFANVFIDPDDEKEMLGSDLFPRDFIYALDPPSNYVGPSMIFDEESPFDLLREIDDADAAFPGGHRSDLVVPELPESLLDAVRCFVVANAIMDERGRGSRHRSMLVNVSHFTGVQEQVRDLISHELRQIQEAVRNYSRLSVDEALLNHTIAELNRVFDSEYSESGTSWEQVQEALLGAALPIEVRAVNQRSGAASLDYSQYRDAGLRVIAVGGNSLSRGLTLEGLCISYFYRGTQMYDALLQMGRWFGYRDGYIDICRLWMSPEAEGFYRHITQASNELRAEIRLMQVARLPPIDFGLKVRAHPQALLLITARNKMKASELVEQGVSVSAKSFESYRLSSEPQIISANAGALKRFVEDLEKSGPPRRESKLGNPLWGSVPKSLVAQLLLRFSGHPLNLTFQARQLAAFLESATTPELDLWDVVIPNGKAVQGEGGPPATAEFGSVSVRLQKRALLADRSKRSLLVSGKKMRVGSRGIEREGMSEEAIARAQAAFDDDPENEGKSISDSLYREHRERPLLLIHAIQGFTTERDAENRKGPEIEYAVSDGPLTALGLSFPRLIGAADGQRVTYYVNRVEWRNMVGEDLADDEDEGDGDA